jgi:hypothetical protein
MASANSLSAAGDPEEVFEVGDYGTCELTRGIKYIAV